MSNGSPIVFEPLKTLSSTVWTTAKMKDSWKWSDRSMEAVIQRFVDLNKRNLDFLGISANIINDGGKAALQLTTSKYVGSVPIKSPINGKIVGDLSVVGRFGENAAELIPLLSDNVCIEYSDEFKLTQESMITPPIYVECCKYIDAYIAAQRYRWRKFDSIVKVRHQPSSSTLWGEYALRTAKDPQQFNVFVNKCNVLSTDHKEWRQLTYVLTLAIRELQSHGVPLRTRITYGEKIYRLRLSIESANVESVTDIRVRMSDPLIIKKLKLIAASILKQKSNERLAWRMDYAEFFERFVQYLFADVARKKNATTINNPHYGVHINRMPSWGLKYLEPDLLVQKGGYQYVVDAKYKSHLFNWDNDNEDLKDAFRHDLHQILAYCAFNNMQGKKALLVYPFSQFVVHHMGITNNRLSTEIDVYLVGLPISKDMIEETETRLADIIIM